MESQKNIELPAWLRTILTPFTPRTGQVAGQGYIVENLWRKYPKLVQFLPRLPGALVIAVLWHAREAFYWRMALAQFCILIIPFADVLSFSMGFILGLVFAFLVLREGYILSDERADCEAITTFMTPALIVVFDLLLGLVSPRAMVPIGILLPRAIEVAVPISLCRFLLSPNPGPDHPYKDLMRLHNRRWFMNLVWIAGVSALMVTNKQAVPSTEGVQTIFFVAATISVFGIAYRFQLDPVSGVSHGSRIDVTLNIDPYRKELEKNRKLLFIGADWFKEFGPQALLEMVACILLAGPLFIGLWAWYSGDATAGTIHWLQLAVNLLAWIALVATWSGIKKANRETKAAFDVQLQKLKTKSAAAHA